MLPSQGLNVYDILRCDTLVLTREAVQRIEERFGAANGAADEVAEEPAAAPMAEAPAEEAMP